MSRVLTTREARKLSGARKTYAGGRPKKPTPCHKCGVECPGARIAQVHCAA